MKEGIKQGELGFFIDDVRYEGWSYVVCPAMC